MYESPHFLDEELIIWNSALGVRDFVTIGRIEEKSGKKQAWLEEPYDMVGPFCLDTFEREGQIDFAACVVMSRQRWHENQIRLRQESYQRRLKAEEEMYEALRKFNRRKQMHRRDDSSCGEEEHRKLLNLPIKGILELTQIKRAYKRVAKMAHPDAGGSQEHFVRITEARDALIALLA